MRTAVALAAGAGGATASRQALSVLQCSRSASLTVQNATLTSLADGLHQLINVRALKGAAGHTELQPLYNSSGSVGSWHAGHLRRLGFLGWVVKRFCDR